MLPLVIVGTAAWYRRRDDEGAKTVLGVLAGVGTIALLILGLGMARSRGGLVLGMLAVLLSLPLALKLRSPRRGTRRLLAAAVSVGMVLVVQFALLGILQRLQKDPFEDGRLQIATVATQVALDHVPLGTGLGGFRPAYERADALPEGQAYVNHAHNDYIELWLEGGWLVLLPAIVLVLAFFAAVVPAWRNMSARAGREPSALRGAAWLSLFLLLLHSVVDYPLRTTALLAVAGLLAAAMTRSRKEVRLHA
jgi:O-antigen ligase